MGKADDNVEGQQTTGFSEEELAGLSESEREALEAGDDDTDALRTVAGEAGDDDDDANTQAAAKAAADKAAAEAKAKQDAEDQRAAEEAAKKRADELAKMNAEERAKAEAADRAAAEAAAKAKADEEAKAKAAQAAEDDDEPLLPGYRAAPPENYEAPVKELEDRKAKATADFKAGAIEVEEMRADHGKVDNERRELDKQMTKAEISAEQAEQNGAARWQWEVNRFMKNVMKHESIDYKGNTTLNAALDAEVKRLATDQANADKSGEWFLETAHDNIKRNLGIVTKGDSSGKDAAARAAEEARKKAEAERRRQAEANRDKLPKSLAGLPSAGAGDVAGEGEFAHLDGLEGMELENAVAKMMPEQQDRYARA